MRKSNDSGSGPRPVPKQIGDRAPARTAWGKLHGFDLVDVERLVLWGRRAGNCNTHASNGDPHTLSKDSTDKNENAKNWEAALDYATKILNEIANPKGLRVDYNGLFPSLCRIDGNGSDSIFIPFDIN